MKELVEMWQEVKPQTREEKIKFAKTVAETVCLGAIGFIMIYLGCLLG